jgi:NTP pyrophosphatase (non-canonical NTP hydrolase)
VDAVVDEIIELRRRGFRFIALADDNFYPVTLADLAMAERQRNVPRLEQLKAKVQEEMGELQQEVVEKNEQNIQNEFGDVLFALVNYARFLNLDPEYCLELSNQKFLKRFRYIEETAQAQNRNLKIEGVKGGGCPIRLVFQAMAAAASANSSSNATIWWLSIRRDRKPMTVVSFCKQPANVASSQERT